MTLLDLLQLIRRRLWLVIVLTLVCAAGAAVYSYGFLTNDYTTTVRLYVLSSKASTSTSDENYVSSSDMTASQQMANDIAQLAKSTSVTNATAEALGMEDLKGYTINVTGSTTNRLISVSVTGKNPNSVALVAGKLATKTADRAKDMMGLEAVNIVDEAEVATAPSGPNRLMIIGVAALVGIFLSLAIIVLMDMLNSSVGSREDIEETFGLPVLGSMPEVKTKKR